MNRNKVCAFGGDALLLAIAAAFLCCVLTGCIIAPVPMTKKINGVAGAPQNQTLDLAFLEVGKTTRSEMRDQLPLVSFTDNDKVFLGRWATSRYGWVWAVGGGGYGGTGAAGAIGGWRTWKMHNLIVEFDETGVATHVVNVPDQQLVSKLARVALPGQTPIGSRLPQEIKIEYLRLRDRGTGYQFAELYLSPEAFVFKNHGARDHDFQIRPADIVGVSRAGILGRDSGEPDPNCVEETLHFRQKTNAGRSITFKIKPSDLLLLVAYLQQNHPAALGNEHRHD